MRHALVALLLFSSTAFADDSIWQLPDWLLKEEKAMTQVERDSPAFWQGIRDRPAKATFVAPETEEGNEEDYAEALRSGGNPWYKKTYGVRDPNVWQGDAVELKQMKRFCHSNKAKTVNGHFQYSDDYPRCIEAVGRWTMHDWPTYKASSLAFNELVAICAASVDLSLPDRTGYICKAGKHAMGRQKEIKCQDEKGTNSDECYFVILHNTILSRQATADVVLQGYVVEITKCYPAVFWSGLKEPFHNFYGVLFPYQIFWSENRDPERSRFDCYYN